MSGLCRSRELVSGLNPQALCTAAAVVLGLMFFTTLGAQGLTLNIIHNFTGGEDGAYPRGGPTIDGVGNLYGTTEAGGGAGKAGTVFKIRRRNSSWVLSPLYAFTSGNDGAAPLAGVIRDSNGILYGTTSQGGQYTYGTVFKLRPGSTAPTTVITPWIESVLYSFQGGNDGFVPGSDLVFDPEGNLYGTTQEGGAYGYGTVFKLTPSDGGWTESVIYSFTGGADGASPVAGVVLDNSGNLYGTTPNGGSKSNVGVVYELTPSGSGWNEAVLYAFQGENDGAAPYAGVILDQSGNLYGATYAGGVNNGGTVFELSPSNGSWTLNVLYSLTGPSGGNGGPAASLTMDAAGNLYGTTLYDGLYGSGSVFKLTSSNNSWTYFSLHDFAGGNDGEQPYSSPVFDSSGNLYGTAQDGGTDGYGIVFQIMP